MVGLPVERALAGDRDVLLLVRVDERRVVHQLRALEPREDGGQVVARVAAEGERRASRDVQVDVALEMHGAGQERPAGTTTCPPPAAAQASIAVSNRRRAVHRAVADARRIA